MAGDRKRKGYRLSLFRLFHRSRPARLEYSGSSLRLKNKEQMKEAQTDEGPSCSQDQKKRKPWLVYPLKRLRKSFSGFMVSSSRRAQRFSPGYICGCYRGVLNINRSGPCESHSDDSNPAEFSYQYVKNLLENNNFCEN